MQKKKQKQKIAFLCFAKNTTIPADFHKFLDCTHTTACHYYLTDGKEKCSIH